MRYKFRNVPLMKFRKMAEFHKQPAEIPKTAAQNPQPFFGSQIRKRHLQIVKARPALTPGQVKPKPCHGRCCTPGGSTGHQAKRSQEKPGEAVFDLLFNAAAHPWYFHILSRRGEDRPIAFKEAAEGGVPATAGRWAPR